MSSGLIDVLIIGGPKNLPVKGGDSFIIKQEPCTLEGLTRACQLIPQAKSVIFQPEGKLFEEEPVGDWC